VVTGDVDLAGRDAVAPVLRAAALSDSSRSGSSGSGSSGQASMTVDLTGVGYLSSAGVALLAEVAAVAGPALSLLVAAGSAPARVCALTGLADALPVRVQDVRDPVGR
jgi:ABC-type transporter Mla MlaB component